MKLTALEQIKHLEENVSNLTDKVAESAASIETLSNEKTQLTADLETAKADLETAKASLESSQADHDAKVKEMQDQLDKVVSDLAQTKAELRDPALKNTKLEETNLSASGEAGNETVKTSAELHAEYNALPSRTLEDARARAEFRAAHKTELGLA